MYKSSLLAFFGMAILCMMDPLIKEMALHYPTIQIAFFRFLFGLVAAGILYLAKRPPLPDSSSIISNSVRSLLVVVSVVTLIYSLGALPLASAISISFLAPMFIVLFAVILLGEQINRYIVSGVLVGFIGVALIVQPGSSETVTDDALLGVIAGIISALTYSLAIILLRYRATKDPVVTIVLFQNIFPMLILLLPAYFVFREVESGHYFYFVGIGFLGVGGHYLLAVAFSMDHASKLASVEYTALIWGILYGYFFFSEVPTLYVLFGATLIISSALLSNRRKNKPVEVI